MNLLPVLLSISMWVHYPAYFMCNSKSNGSLSPIVLQYLSLASGGLQFLNAYFVNTSDEVLQKFLRDSFTDEHMASLAAVIKEMDKESARIGPGLY